MANAMQCKLTGAGMIHSSAAAADQGTDIVKFPPNPMHEKRLDRDCSRFLTIPVHMTAATCSSGLFQPLKRDQLAITASLLDNHVAQSPSVIFSARSPCGYGDGLPSRPPPSNSKVFLANIVSSQLVTVDRNPASSSAEMANKSEKGR